MNVIRRALVVAVVLAGALVPQVPLQASELVKLGRLIVTGKRAPVPAATEEPKLLTARPLAEPAERPVAAVRGPEAAADAREARDARDVRESANVVQTERAGTEPSGKPPLERGGSGSVSGAGAGAGSERSESFFSFKSVLRGF